MVGFCGWLLVFGFVHWITAAATQHGQCAVGKLSRSDSSTYNCIELVSLGEHLEKAPVNTTEITVVESKIPSILRYSFIRFSSTLESLVLRKCGITMIDQFGLAGLVMLKKLVLWDNNLTWISADSFRDLTNLRHLDISFNKIVGIDIAFYQMLPNLENFYFDYNQLQTIDYNMFAAFPNLKKAKIGHNPWVWGYRILLEWQLDSARVDYRDDWEEWGWMNSIVRECQDSGKATALNDTMLDCVVTKFLHMEIDHGHFAASSIEQSDKTCLSEGTALVRCSKNNAPAGSDPMRLSLESLVATMPFLSRAGGKYIYNHFK
ncbi:uncharacterized protein [Venturia canescens]|uniref:uncharacterized protein n=1 Tax=Venturia canescens TaxID=32260 RepID=UPI001C9C949C|nr:uncharacterized protein LOC122413588 [Venturia canescens]